MNPLVLSQEYSLFSASREGYDIIIYMKNILSSILLSIGIFGIALSATGYVVMSIEGLSDYRYGFLFYSSFLFIPSMILMFITAFISDK